MIRKVLNIVYIADIPQTGGASESLLALIERMSSEYDAKCTVLFPADGPLKKRVDSVGARSFVTGHRGFLVSRPSARWKIAPKYVVEYARYRASFGTSLRKAESMIDFSQVDIIHSNLPRNDLGIVLAAKYGIPHVCHLREFSFEDFQCWSYKRDAGRYISDGSDALIAVSQACAEAWIRRGVDRRKLHVIYNGVNLRRFQVRSESPRDRKRDITRIVFLGGLSEAKGTEEAITAIALLPDSIRSRVKLDIYGSESCSQKRIAEKQIKRFGLCENVSIHGRSNDVAALLPDYDIGLVCSRSEAFGRVVVEYQAAGLAVIGPDTGSVPELLKGGSRGCIYHKADGPGALAMAIESLISKGMELERLKSLGPSFASSYDRDKNAKEILAVYEQLLDRLPVKKDDCYDESKSTAKTI